MRSNASQMPGILAVAFGVSSVLACPLVVRAADRDVLLQGKSISFDAGKGNCLACHRIEDGESPGDLGPPLVSIQARYPDRAQLRKQLWDPMELNPASRMPPFGRHRILTEAELDMVVEYLYTL